MVHVLCYGPKNKEINFSEQVYGIDRQEGKYQQPLCSAHLIGLELAKVLSFCFSFLLFNLLLRSQNCHWTLPFNICTLFTSQKTTFILYAKTKEKDDKKLC